MTNPAAHNATEILNQASQRADAQGLAYRGAVTPQEAYALLQAGVATVIDVRTRFEAEYVGRIENAYLIEWRALGAPATNANFLEQLAAVGKKDAVLLFLCRSGARSHAAALAASSAGYVNAFNILEGFEGDLDAQKHRGTQGGWRYHGLPWIQG